MNDSVFGRDYAGEYDLLYGTKDYEAECDLLEEVFRRYAEGTVQTILDLGCGTGSHAFGLALRGYQVTGVDRSEDMLCRFRQKAADGAAMGHGSQPTCHTGDIRRINLNRRFDAVSMMFSVLGYQMSNDDVVMALLTARRHLKPGGLLVFDIWNGPAVLCIRPEDRVRVIDTSHGKVVRTASSALDTRHHWCTVDYCVQEYVGDRLVREAREIHQVRFFFPMEMELFLSQAGFDLISLTGFPDLEQQADETMWSVLGVARALPGSAEQTFR